MSAAKQTTSERTTLSLFFSFSSLLFFYLRALKKCHYIIMHLQQNDDRWNRSSKSIAVHQARVQCFNAKGDATNEWHNGHTHTFACTFAVYNCIRCGGCVHKLQIIYIHGIPRHTRLFTHCTCQPTSQAASQSAQKTHYTLPITSIYY